MSYQVAGENRRGVTKIMTGSCNDASEPAPADTEASDLPDYLRGSEGDTIPDDTSVHALVAPKVETPLPESAMGLYGTHRAERRYGTERTIAALVEIGKSFAAAHGGRRIGIGDISKRGGGKISGHASHQKGVDVDVRLMRTDGKEAACRFQDAVYSRALTQALVNAFQKNTVFPVSMIFFNDPKVSGVRPWPNHDNHLHVRFKLP